MILLSLLLAFSAQAKSFPERENLYVPVPRSELQIEVPETQSEEPGTAELGISTWEPDDFERKDYRNQSGKFTGSFPLLSLSYASSLVRFSHSASLRTKFGVSFASLTRKGLALGRNAEVEQTLDLYMARAGLEYNGPVFLTRLQPYVGFALLPTLGLSGQSELESSVSVFGLGFEADAGLLLRTKWEFLGFTQATFGAGAHRIFGSLEDSKLGGWGAQGFIRVGI